MSDAEGGVDLLYLTPVSLNPKRWKQEEQDAPVDIANGRRASKSFQGALCFSRANAEAQTLGNRRSTMLLWQCGRRASNRTLRMGGEPHTTPHPKC